MAEARNCSASERSQDRRVPLCRDFARGCSAVNHGREFTARTTAITIANCRSTVIKTANRTIRAYYDWRWTRNDAARPISPDSSPTSPTLRATFALLRPFHSQFSVPSSFFLRFDLMEGLWREHNTVIKIHSEFSRALKRLRERERGRK